MDSDEVGRLLKHSVYHDSLSVALCYTVHRWVQPVHWVANSLAENTECNAFHWQKILNVWQYHQRQNHFVNARLMPTLSVTAKIENLVPNSKNNARTVPNCWAIFYSQVPLKCHIWLSWHFEMRVVKSSDSSAGEEKQCKVVVIILYSTSEFKDNVRRLSYSR